MHDVAVIGGGPAGLVAAKYLKQHGWNPVVFERCPGIGGQWSGDPQTSGVWPMMRTNTSRIMTCFSDLPHGPEVAVYPTNQQMLNYLQRYARRFDLLPHIRTGTRVTGIRRGEDASGWLVQYTADGESHEQRFGKVIVAAGRYHRPAVPALPGLESFRGARGIAHTFEYKAPERYRGQRVLVAGSSISALEIAADLAMLGAARVISSYRRQRYIFQKLLGGVPTDHIAFTRFGALCEGCMSPEAQAAGLKELILRTCGSPEQYGAPKPADNVFEAGITQCQAYLPLVAEGRIICKPWISHVDGKRVQFDDGSEEEIDAIVFGTGYDLDLPFLSAEHQQLLGLDAQHIDLHKLTFHPDLDDIAFLGLFMSIGPSWPVLELQARWVTYAWTGVVPMPTREEMLEGIAAYRRCRAMPQEQPAHRMAIMFSREIGTEPDLRRWPQLARALLFGPLSSISFRLSGPDALPDAAQRYAADARAFGCMTSCRLSDQEREQLRALASASHDAVSMDLAEEDAVATAK